MGLETYKNIQVVNGAAGDGGIALTNSLKVLADHEDGDGTDHSGIGSLTGDNSWEGNNTFVGDLYTTGDIEYQNTFWDDIRVPVLSTKLGGTKTPGFAKVLDNGVGSQGVFAYNFDDSTEEEVYFMCQIPHTWKEGTNLQAHVHWMPTVNGGAGEKVSWGLEYSWQSIGSVFGNTTLAYGDTPTTTGTLVADKHYLTEIADIDGSGHTFSSMLICRLFRDAGGVGGTDDYSNDATLLEFDFHYEIDSPGTSEEYVK